MIRTILSTFLLISFVKSTQTHPSNETCYQNSYSTRDYLREEEVSGIISPIPILFLSNPGSGSTHARLLLEFATGLFTGSIYTDANLVQLLPGDRFCGLRLAGRSFICIPFHSIPFLFILVLIFLYIIAYIITSAIKSYPNDVSFSNNTNEPLFTVRDKDMKRKCKKGLIMDFSRVIVLFRDPFHAIWAAYQRNVYTSASHPTQPQQTNDGISSSNNNDETSRLNKKRKGVHHPRSSFSYSTGTWCSTLC